MGATLCGSSDLNARARRLRREVEHALAEEVEVRVGERTYRVHMASEALTVQAIMPQELAV